MKNAGNNITLRLLFWVFFPNLRFSKLLWTEKAFRLKKRCLDKLKWLLLDSNFEMFQENKLFYTEKKKKNILMHLKFNNEDCFLILSVKVFIAMACKVFFNSSTYLFCSVSLNYKIVALDFRFGDYIWWTQRWLSIDGLLWTSLNFSYSAAFLKAELVCLFCCDACNRTNTPNP